MKLIYIAALVLVVFVLIWRFFVVPAERKHHERKLAAVRKRIEQRETAHEEKKYAKSDPDRSEGND